MKKDSPQSHEGHKEGIVIPAAPATRHSFRGQSVAMFFLRVLCGFVVNSLRLGHGSG